MFRRARRGQLENALEVRKQHLDLFAEPTRGAALPRPCDLARHVASAQDLAKLVLSRSDRRFRAAV